MSDDPQNPFHGFRLEIDPERIEEALRDLRARLQDKVQQGRYIKVRLSYKGNTVGPDIPLGMLLGAEGLAFWLMSPLGALALNLGAKAILDVEFIHDADELVREGIEHWLDGDVAKAEALYRQALERRDDDAAALYNLGVLLRVTGRTDEARDMLQRAAMGPEGHPDVVKAAEAIAKMDGKRTL